MSRVVVGLSGGVDSSVAAHLLLEKGHEVIGIFMRNWHDESVTLSDECPWIEDSNDAMLVAERLGIPFQVLDLSDAYKSKIVDYMFSEYQAGRTPNPDVLCNREIKFDIFMDEAIKLGADYVATGHYCQKKTSTIKGQEIHHLISGADKSKDQSYFLCQLNQSQLAKALFPIGHLQKKEVRALASELDLVTADKKDSQGLCFIGKVKLPDFLQQQLQPKKGRIIEVADEDTWFQRDYTSFVADEIVKEQAKPYAFFPSMGAEVGEHSGAHYFTIGQRKGLNVGGRPEPSFVIATDVDENIIYTGQGENHRGLFRKALRILKEDIHWLREDLRMNPGDSRSYQVRIRYRQPLCDSKLIMTDDSLYILFEQAQRGVAPGQFSAWYDQKELLGSGVIA